MGNGWKRTVDEAGPLVGLAGGWRLAGRRMEIGQMGLLEVIRKASPGPEVNMSLGSCLL